MSHLKLHARRIREGLRSPTPTIPDLLFYIPPATGLADRATSDLRDCMREKYGEDIAASPASKRAMSASEQYETNLLPHAEYIIIHHADLRIMRHFRGRLRKLTKGNLLFDLGFGNGDTTAELASLTRPGKCWGVDILSGVHRSLKIKLAALSDAEGVPLLDPQEDLRTWRVDFYDSAYWRDMKKEFARARQLCAHIRFTNLGLGIGNADSARFANLLEYMRPCMEEGDIFFVSNDATGTYGRVPYDVAAERARLHRAYNPPGSLPYLHYVAHVAFKYADLQPPDHRAATAIIKFNEDSSRIERKLVFDKPQLLTPDLYFGIAGARNLGSIREINLMSSYKRSLQEMSFFARCRDMDIDREHVLTDPDRRTRIAWVPFIPKFRRYRSGHSLTP